MTIRALVIDDEELARDRICALLQTESDVEIVGECDGGRQAIEAIRAHRPDLLFLDVQMPEVDGFAVIEELAPEEFPVVIFVTAHEEHALQAFEVHALDYLLKSFREDRFRETLARARSALASKESVLTRSLHDLLQSRRARQPHENRLVIRAPGWVVFIPHDEIDWCEAAGNYVLVHVGERSHLLRETMNDLEARLPSQKFLRIHPSALVNLSRVTEVRGSVGGGARVILRGKKELPLSRRYRRRFEEALRR